jgi:H+/Cl- antiporter ClcA/CBS domain-containing protein
MTRSSRTEAATGVSEAGMSVHHISSNSSTSDSSSPLYDSNGSSTKNNSSSLNNNSSSSSNAPPGSRTHRRHSLVKQDVTLDYFRDRRPNKYSGMRRPITNTRNVFSMRWKTLILLWALGALTGTVHKAVVLLENALFLLKTYLTEAAHDASGGWAGFLVFLAFTVIVTGASLALTHNISPVAAGSGIPQMKTQLTGTKIKNYLSLKTLIAKILGLTTAVGAGLYVGQEGPFVHIASCIANNLIIKVGPFNRIRDNKAVQLAILEAACAVGVSSTFRSPIGGVLFSIEVTSTYYMVSNYWKGFLAAISALLMSHLIDVMVTLDTGVDFKPLFYVEYPAGSYFLWELPIFAALGAVLGLTGAASVNLTKFLAMTKNKVLSHYTPGARETIWGISVAVITSLVYLLGPFFHRANKENILDLVDTKDLNSTMWRLPETLQEQVDSPYSICIPLMVFFLVNFLLGAMSLSVAVPCGCILPLLAGGAGFGRMVGEIVQLAVEGQKSLPGGYGLVGAAAFTAGATRTVSIAVIVLELTGQMEFIIPVFVGVFAACICGSHHSLSIYDMILKSRALPYLPNVILKPNALVSEVMTKDVPCLSKSCTTIEMLKVLRQTFVHDIPVVDSTHTNLLHGCVSRQEIEQVVRQFYAEHNLPGVEDDIAPQNVGGEDSLSPLSGDVPANKKKLMNKSHELLHHREVHVQAAPFTLNAQTPCDDVHIIFTMLKCKFVYVLSYGMLVGVVTIDDLLAANVDTEEAAMGIYASLRVPKKTKPYRQSIRRGVRTSVRNLVSKQNSQELFTEDIGEVAVKLAKEDLDAQLAATAAKGLGERRDTEGSNYGVGGGDDGRAR